MHEIKKYLIKPLILIGALNWGCIGLFNYNPISALFGGAETPLRIIYGIVGLAAVVCIVMMFANREE